MRRFFALLAFVFIFSTFSYAESDEASETDEASGVTEIIEGSETSEVDEDMDSLFSDGEDIDVDQNENTDGSSRTGIDKAFSATPLRFTGNLNSSIGLYTNYLYLPDESHKQEKVKDYLSGYFSFSNDLFLTARIDKSFMFRARINTTFPDEKLLLSFKELYCDYLFLDRVYITLGRKISSWGYTRIFSSGDTYKNEKILTDSDVRDKIEKEEQQGFLHTDILYDTADTISAMIRIPVWTGMISGILYYDLSVGATYPTLDDLKVALSVEFTFGHTTVNLFGKKYDEKEESYEKVVGTKIVGHEWVFNPPAGYDPATFDPTSIDSTKFSEYFVLKPIKENITKKVTVKKQSYPLIGLEAKRTIGGFDLYGQFIITFDNWKKFDVNKLFATAGFYRYWDNVIPNVGFNIEYQHSYDFDIDKNRNRVAVDFGLKKMGKHNDLKLGINWQHKFMEREGTVKVVFIKGGIWRHCDWETAFEYRYNEESTGAIAKFQLATSLKINVDY